VTRGHAELADLDVGAVVVQVTSPETAMPALFERRSKDPAAGKFGGEFLQPRTGRRVKTSLLLLVIGAALSSRTCRSP
jgi:hypothetical protein